MKRFNYILFGILGLVLSAVSCSGPEEENTVINKPTKFVLNTPAFQKQYIDLQNSSTMNLSCSQPDDGFAAAASYFVQVSLTEDFADFIEIEEAYSKCDMDVNSEAIAQAICKLRGVTSEDDYTDEPARTVYFRIRAQILDYEETNILSNVVSCEKVKGYFALKLPGYIYLVGEPEGWSGPTEGNKDHYASWRLYESSEAIGSKIYSGVFDIPAGKFMFRFYTALTGWETDSYGIQVDDSPMDIELDANGVYSGEIVKGKGSYNVPDFAGGSVKITVNMNTMTVKFEVGGVDVSNKKFIYLVGAPEGWAGPSEDNASHYEDWKLYDMADDGNYTGTFDIPEGKFQFRFYKKLSGWDGGDSYGSQADDAPVDIEFTDGIYEGAAMDGKGSWQDPTWAGGKVEITVNINDGTVLFEQK